MPKYVFICFLWFGCVGSESFGIVLKQLLNDLTGPEITACAELNLMPSLCYSQDLALLGPGLQDMDQHYIEEQVRPQSNHLANSFVNEQSMSLIDSLVTAQCMFNFIVLPVCLKLHGGGSGGGTLEYDPFTIFEKAQEIPTPLPPASALTAAAVQLFGVIFPHLGIQQRYVHHHHRDPIQGCLIDMVIHLYAVAVWFEYF